MLLQFVILIPVSYLVFVFISSLFNPFVITKAPLKRRSWRLGRAAAVSSLVAGALAIVALNTYSVNSRVALSLYLVLLGLFVIPSIITYHKNAIWR